MFIVIVSDHTTDWYTYVLETPETTHLLLHKF